MVASAFGTMSSSAIRRKDSFFMVILFKMPI
jgi:hypothetical protein